MEIKNTVQKTVTLTKATYDSMIDKFDLCITAERLESAIILLYEMQDEYFRSHTPDSDPQSGENIMILHEFNRYRKVTNAIAELLQLIQEDFEAAGISD